MLSVERFCIGEIVDVVCVAVKEHGLEGRAANETLCRLGSCGDNCGLFFIRIVAGTWVCSISVSVQVHGEVAVFDMSG